MKYLYLPIALFFVGVSSCYAQHNKLNDNELFKGIKFNDISLEKIMNTNGDYNKLKVLFSNNLIFKPNNTGFVSGKDFWSNDLYLNFEDERDNGSYDLAYIEVTKPSAKVTVRGKTYNIGDDINKFLGLKIHTYKGEKIIIFTDGDTGSTSLSFNIDKITNKVSSIKFFSSF